MAELEIHYPDGLVVYKPLSRAKAVVIGRRAECDVRIEAPGVQSEHAAIRWRSRGYKLEVGPGIKNVYLNGVAIKRATLSPDDEFAIGDYKFTVRGNDEELQGSRLLQEKQAEDAARDDLLEQVDMEELAGAEAIAAPADPLEAHEAKAAIDAYYTPMWKSPLLMGIGGSLLGAVVIGLALWLIVQRLSAEKQFDAAMLDYGDGLFVQAIKRFDKFLEEFPRGDLAEKAIVWRGIARVRQFADGSAPLWANALEADRQLAEEASELEFFGERSKEIADLFVRTATGLATQARDAADQTALDQAVQAIELITTTFPKDQQPFEQIDQARGILAEARFRIEKDAVLQASLAQIDKELEAKRPMAVYQEHRRLSLRYPDLKTHPQLLARREKARQLERLAVTFERLPEGSKEAAAVAAPAPALTFVRRQATAGAASLEQTVSVQVADTLYGLDRGTGGALWRQMIGFEPSFEATRLVGDVSKLLVHRSYDNALSLLETRTGKELWRRPLAPFVVRWQSQPLVHRGNVYLIGHSPESPNIGRLLVYRVSNGEPVGQYVFPQRLSESPIFDADRQRLLVLGENVSLYTLDLNSRQCEQVLAVDHQADAIRCPPQMIGRFLFIFETEGLNVTHLRLFLISSKDGSLKQKQVVDLDGWVWHPPFLRAGRLFVTTDRGRFFIYDLGAEEDEQPLTLAVESDALTRARRREQPFPYATGQRELWTVGRQIDLYEINMTMERPRPESSWQLPLGGPSTMAPTVEGGVMVVAAQDSKTGRVAVLGMDLPQRTNRWRTELGSLPDGVRTDPQDAKKLIVLEGSRTTSLMASDLTSDRVLEEPLSNAGPPKAGSTGAQTLPQWSEGTLQWLGVGSHELWLYPPSGARRTVPLPTTLSARPERFGGGMLLPGSDGLLYWLDPRTGRELCEPFVGPYLDGRTTPIGRVLPLDAQSVVVVAENQLLRLSVASAPFPHFKETGRFELREPGSTYFAMSGDRLLLTDGPELLSLAPSNLETLDRWPLTGVVTKPPIAAQDFALFLTDRNELICVAGSGADVDIRWREQCPARPLGEPLLRDGIAWVAFADGRITGYRLADGEVADEWNAGRAIVDGPWILGDGFALLTPDGSLTSVRKPASEGGR